MKPNRIYIQWDRTSGEWWINTGPTGTVPGNNLKVWNLMRFSNGFILTGKIDHGNKQRSRKPFPLGLTHRAKTAGVKKPINTYNLSILLIQGNFSIFMGRSILNGEGRLLTLVKQLCCKKKDAGKNQGGRFFPWHHFRPFPIVTL